MQKQTGFTLVELMVTVVVVAILASIAIPSYTAYVTRGKLTEATSNLADLRVRMEQHFQDNRTYVGGPCEPAAGTARYFTYACSPVATATTYTVVATGIKAQFGDKDYAFTIDQDNTKRTTAFPDTTVPVNCWITKAGESC